MIGNGYSGYPGSQYSPEVQPALHKCSTSSHESRQRSRISQLLEALKFEFDVLMQDMSLFKTQRNEFERLLTTQVAELNTLRQSLQDLERVHLKMKRSYEDVIRKPQDEKLKRLCDTVFKRPCDDSVFKYQCCNINSRQQQHKQLQSDQDVKPHGHQDQQLNGHIFSMIPSGQKPCSSYQNNTQQKDIRMTSEPASQPYRTSNMQSSTKSITTGFDMNSMKMCDQQQQRQQQQSQPNKKYRTDTSVKPLPLHSSPPISQNSPLNYPTLVMNDINRDNSVQCTRHSCTESYVVHATRKMQRVDTGDRRPSNSIHLSPNLNKDLPDKFTQNVISDKDIYPTSVRHSIDDSQQQISFSAPITSNSSTLDQDKPKISKNHSKDYYKHTPSTLPPMKHSTKLLKSSHRRSPQKPHGHNNSAPQTQYSQNIESDLISRTWSKGNVNFTVAHQPKCENINSPMLKIELVHDLSPESVVCCVRFSDDGEMLATGCNHVAHIYNVFTGNKISTLTNEQVQNDSDLYIRSLCFSPNAKYLATGAEDHVIRVWDIQCRKIHWSFDTHEQDIYSLDWFKKENLLVSGSGDKTIRVWDIDQGTCTLTMSNDDSKFLGGNSKITSSSSRETNVTSVAVNPVYSKCIATGSLDGIVRLWDLQTSSLLERLDSHKNSVYSVSFSPDGKSLVSGSLDKLIKVWDLNPQTLTYLNKTNTFKPPASVQTPTLAPKKLSSSSNNTTTLQPPDELPAIEPVVNQTPRRNFIGHTDFVLSVAFAGSDFIPAMSYGQNEDDCVKPDEQMDAEWIISGSKDCNVILWGSSQQSAASRKDKSRQNSPADGYVHKLVLQGHENSVISVAIAPHSGIFATGSGDKHARIWKISSFYNQKHNYTPRNSTGGSIAQRSSPHSDVSPPLVHTFQNAQLPNNSCTSPAPQKASSQTLKVAIPAHSSSNLKHAPPSSPVTTSDSPSI